MPYRSTFSVNRHGRFRESDVFRLVFESVVTTCVRVGLVGGEGFAVDASVVEADDARASQGAVRLQRQSPERPARRRDRRRRGDDDTDIDGGRCCRDNARSGRRPIRPSAESDRRRRRLQLGRAARRGRRALGRAAHPDVGQGPARRWNLLKRGLRVRRRTQCLCLSARQVATDHRPRCRPS